MRRPIELPGYKVREMMLGGNFGRSRMDGVAMQNAPDPALGHACPHLDKNDPRCQDRFRMAELDAMYRYCLGGFYGCPMFHRINREETHQPRAAPAPRTQPLTIHGRFARRSRDA